MGSEVAAGHEDPDSILDEVDAFEFAASGMVVTDVHGVFHRVNAAFAALVGRSARDLVDQPFASLTSPDDMAVSRSAMRDLIERRVPSVRFEKRYLRPDGTLVWVDMCIRALVAADGTVRGFLADAMDISARKATEVELWRQAQVLEQAEARFRLAFDNVPVGMLMRSLRESDSGRILRANPALCTMLGYSPDELLRRGLVDITHPDDRDQDAAVTARLVSGELASAALEKRFIHRDGRTVWAAVHIAVVRDGDGAPQYTVTQIEDVTARRAAVEELTERALHDPLTRLANRSLLLDRLEHALARTRRHKHANVALLFVDVDDFKSVNDNFGHVVGDQLLVQVADRLGDSVRPGDTVARLGGDEFVVVCEDMSGAKAAERVARRVTVALDAPFVLRLHDGAVVEVGTGASVGIVVTSGGEPSADVLRRADEAMYAVKAVRKAGRARDTAAETDEQRATA